MEKSYDNKLDGLHFNMDKSCYSWYCECSNAQLDLLRPCILNLLYCFYCMRAIFMFVFSVNCR